MELTLQYWYMFFVSILIATIAMASGVGGATFFAPFFLLALRLPPEVAIGTGLITEVFGFASGLIAYARKKLIDYQLGLNLVIVTIPAALLGAWLAGSADPEILKVVLGVGLFAVAISFLRSPDSVFIIAVTTLAASSGHFIRFLDVGGETLEMMIGMTIAHCHYRDSNCLRYQPTNVNLG